MDLLHGIEVVSWDVDGTLYDLGAMRRALSRQAVRALFSRRVFRVVSELRALRRFQARMEARRAAGGVLRGDDRRAAAADLSDLRRRWLGPAIARVGVRAGVVSLLDRFRARGLRQIAFSDYPADFKLEALGLADRFERVLSGEALGLLKPARALLEHVQAELQVPAPSILHLGDRADTDGGAAAAGWRVVVFGRDVATPSALHARLRGAPG